MLITNFLSKEDLMEYAHDKIVKIVVPNQVKYKSTSLFMSGGNSIQLYKKIAKDQSIQSKFLELFQVDERYVEKNQEYSNQKQLSEIFENYPNENINFINTGFLLEKCVSDYESQLSKINQPDIIILGFGLDGHFASIFPDDKVTQNLESKSMVLNTQSMSGYPVTDRISLSPNYISKAKKIFVILIGPEKKEILQEFLGGKLTAEQFPAKYWLNNEKIEILTCFE
jgi:6-phosphogluconolactonase